MSNDSQGPGPTKSPVRAKSADRALQILEYLATVPEGTSFSEIAGSLGLPKSSAHELLAVMTDRSFVEFRPESKVYRLGIRTWELGQASVAHRDLISEARPVMVSISSTFDETVQISVLDGFDEVYLDRVDSSQTIRVHTMVGSRLPAHITALGKVLLSDKREVTLLTGLRGKRLDAMTKNTISTVDTLIQELRWIRAHGFALDNEEYALGLRCVAVPVRDHTGGIVAAMSVAMPTPRADADRLTDSLMALVKGSNEISRGLGCDVALLSGQSGHERGPLRDTIESKMAGLARPGDNGSATR